MAPAVPTRHHCHASAPVKAAMIAKAEAYFVTAAPAPIYVEPVIPCGVFVANRNIFDCIVTPASQGPTIKEAIFRALPLFENGWERGRTDVIRIGADPRGGIWRVTRHEQNLIRPLHPLRLSGAHEVNSPPAPSLVGNQSGAQA